jgi:hypothetical protein
MSHSPYKKTMHMFMHTFHRRILPLVVTPMANFDKIPY